MHILVPARYLQRFRLQVKKISKNTKYRTLQKFQKCKAEQSVCLPTPIFSSKTGPLVNQCLQIDILDYIFILIHFVALHLGAVPGLIGHAKTCSRSNLSDPTLPVRLTFYGLVLHISDLYLGAIARFFDDLSFGLCSSCYCPCLDVFQTLCTMCTGAQRCTCQ